MKPYITLVFFLSSCASIQSLSGGEKDTTPPEVVSLIPKNKELNVTSKNITIEFNEYVRSAKLNDVIIISPSQKLKPEIKVKGKKVYIKLLDSLKSNTTYRIQLNQGVVDNNESNPCKDFNYVFSTGSYIDSMKYSGFVYSFLTKEPLKNYNIQLYKSQKDSSVINDIPNYISRSNEDGSFDFYNLPEEKLMVAVFEDQNKNLSLNKNEPVAMLKFIDTRNNNNDSFYTFINANTDKYKIKKTNSIYPGIICLSVNKPINDDLKLILNDKEINYQLTDSRDTVYGYFNTYKDTNIITVTIDSILYRFPIKKIKKSITPKLEINKKKSNKKNILIESTIPGEINTKFIKIKNDSSFINYEIENINPLKYQLYIKDDIKGDLKIILEDSAFISFFKVYSQKDTLDLNISNRYINNLYLNLNVKKQTNYIIELLSNNKLIKRKVVNNNNNKITFKNLKPGVYSLRIIEDLNKNNIWDSGEIFTKKDPEKVYLYKKIEIRDNWDKDLIINVL